MRNLNIKFRIKKKAKGFIAAQAILAMVLFGMFAIGFFQLYGGQFALLSSSQTALQAQQYAEISANTLRLLPYDELETKGQHTRKIMDNTDNNWEDAVTISAEKVLDADTGSKQKIGTIKVYKVGDSSPRFTLNVPLSSQGGSTLPIGTILPYIGALNKVPYGWFLCDGSNGTPDLRDRFLTCAGAAYTVGNTGGENFHQLTIEEMPKHNHGVYGGLLADWEPPDDCCVPSFSGSIVGQTNFSGNDQPHENRPPFYAVYYIIRLK